MKKILVLALFLSLFMFSCGEDDPVEPEPTGPVLSMMTYDSTLSGFTAFDDEVITYATFKNNSDNEIQVEVSVEMTNLFAGHSATLCTELCYAPQTQNFIAPGKITVAANTASKKEDFSGHIYPYQLDPSQKVAGSGTVRYRFTVVGKPAETVYYDVNYTFN